MSAAVFGLGILAYVLWGQRAGLSLASLKGAAMVSFGLVCAVLALSSPARRFYFAGTLALVPLGLVLPYCSSRETLLAGGLAMSVAGLIAALIQAAQLRAARRNHERAAN